MRRERLQKGIKFHFFIWASRRGRRVGIPADRCGSACHTPPLPPLQQSVSPSYRAVGLSVPMFFCLPVSVGANHDLLLQQVVRQYLLRHKAKKHFHFYPSRDARTVTVCAIVRTSTADSSPFIVSRPCRGEEKTRWATSLPSFRAYRGGVPRHVPAVTTDR